MKNERSSGADGASGGDGAGGKWGGNDEGDSESGVNDHGENKGDGIDTQETPGRPNVDKPRGASRAREEIGVMVVYPAPLPVFLPHLLHRPSLKVTWCKSELDLINEVVQLVKKWAAFVI